MSVQQIPLDNAVQVQITTTFGSARVADKDILSGPCRLTKLIAIKKAQDYAVRLYDNKDPVVGSTIPDIFMQSASGSGEDILSFPEGLVFSSGISGVALDVGTLDTESTLSTANAVFHLELLPGVS